MQHAAAAAQRAQFERGRFQAVEGTAHVLQVALADGGQTDALAFAAEQFGAEVLFERLDLAADRALRQGQFAGGGGDAAVVGGGLERLQGGGGREGSGHLMSICQQLMQRSQGGGCGAPASAT